MYLLFNANADSVKVTIPEGKWDVCINGQKAGTDVIETIDGGELTIDGISALVLVKQSNSNIVKIIVGVVVAVVVIAIVVMIVMSRKKKNK